jgi:hypothetical protein
MIDFWNIIYNILKLGYTVYNKNKKTYMKINQFTRLLAISLSTVVMCVGVGAVAVNIDKINIIPGTKPDIETKYFVSNELKINKGCDYINDLLFQSEDPFTGNSKTTESITSLIGVLNTYSTEYTDLIDSKITEVTALSEPISKQQINTLLINQNTDLITKNSKLINSNIDGILNYRFNAGKSHINKEVIRLKSKQNNSFQFLSKVYDSIIADINSTALRDEIKKDRILDNLNSLNSNLSKVFTKVIADYQKLNDDIENNKIGSILSTKLINDKCEFTIKTLEDDIKLLVPLIIEPICKSENPNKLIKVLDNSNCIIINN